MKTTFKNIHLYPFHCQIAHEGKITTDLYLIPCLRRKPEKLEFSFFFYSLTDDTVLRYRGYQLCIDPCVSRRQQTRTAPQPGKSKTSIIIYTYQNITKCLNNNLETIYFKW